MKIPFTKLYQQYIDCKTEIDQAISNVIESSSFITGPDVTKFEKVMSQYVGAEDCASTGSGTMALLCSLRAAGIGPGDEVLTTPHTFVATTEAIVMVGADPVFVDIDPDTHLIDLDLLETKITTRSRAVLFVDIYGQCPDMDRLRAICIKHNLLMIEDAAHSLGTQWLGKQIGSLADITCFSFNPVKNLGAMGDAGCVTGSHEMMERVRMYRDHGRIGRYDIVELGYNARIDNMQSNIVLAKLPKLAHWINRKRAIASYYNEQLNGIVKTITLDSRVGQGHYVYVIQTPRRDELKKFLEQRGIQTNIHYATTTHLQPAYKKWYVPCPVADRTVNEILSLPCYYNLTVDECEYIVTSVKEFFQ
jgi:dTDP-4-amino-4,6-dideoxygalactose transaminase